LTEARDRREDQAWLRLIWADRQNADPDFPYFGIAKEMVCNNGETADGAYHPGGEGFLFAWPQLSRRSDAHAQAIIAHELAHAFLRARGLHHSDEDLVDQITHEWGFPIGEVRAADAA
jgi:hypothetical protein